LLFSLYLCEKLQADMTVSASVSLSAYCTH